MKIDERELPKIDQLVAEQVMRWSRADAGLYLVRDRLCVRPRFTVDMTAAWVAVEELRAEGYQFQLSENPGEWIAIFDGSLVDGGQTGVGQFCETAALAICAAALAVRGISIEDLFLGATPGTEAVAG